MGQGQGGAGEGNKYVLASSMHVASYFLFLG